MRLNLLRRACGVALLLAVALSLSACGGTDEPEDEPESTVPSSAPLPTTTPGSPPPDTTASLPPPTRGEVTVRGVVQQGVEAGCLLLDGEGGPYLLLGGQQELRAGAEVVVRGRVERDTMTTCQQGVPLKVTEVRPG
ncbi:hypothetical protein SAMN05216266_12643 [Amycolatopsis marina]|uniref:Uncharacterized protein n=1 Tax=Amycolatopsis marina TaxID=490629 RepID=A0A1I1CDR5_9PSEU|nr:hypothetical protein [Amycolatopsis marina]SFB60801.1 hypothetical protein SAMN05216266_12643 [Amycolatopsis marina]